jgi:hypothetical protein
MKKIVALLTCFLVIIIALHAQKKQPKFLVELGVGPSFPIGKFAGKSYTNLNEKDPDGLAKPGLAANVTVGYYLNSSIGVLVTGGYSENKQDPSSYEDYLRRYWLTGYSNVNAQTNKWKVKKVMGGIFWITPLTSSSKIKLLTKLAAGICKTAVPGFSYKASSIYSPGSLPSGSMYAEGYQGKMTLKTSFCYQVSVEGQYKLNNRLYALLDISSFNAAPQKTITYMTNEPVPIGTGISYRYRTEKRTFKLSSINVLAGIGLNF